MLEWRNGRLKRRRREKKRLQTHWERFYPSWISWLLDWFCVHSSKGRVWNQRRAAHCPPRMSPWRPHLASVSSPFWRSPSEGIALEGERAKKAIMSAVISISQTVMSGRRSQRLRTICRTARLLVPSHLWMIHSRVPILPDILHVPQV